jgi:hypothetical protein
LLALTATISGNGDAIAIYGGGSSSEGEVQEENALRELTRAFLAVFTR